MPILSHFFLNSDFTAPKEQHSFDKTLDVAGLYLNSFDSTTRTTDIEVPNGVYFENTTITFDMPGSTRQISPTPFIVYAKEVDSYQAIQIYAGLRKISNSKYQIYATIQNMSQAGRTIPDFSVRVQCHLFVSA